ncbi:MAG: hypothetical protein H6742_00685 [Alphaproteobacteria bacterium]|nr:hypothetical protein [Alphaproteobacteria bacterium]
MTDAATAEPARVPSPAPQGLRAHLRAAFVVFHVAAVLLAAMPAPDGGMKRAAWKDRTVQEEFAAWTGRLQGLGVEIEQPELEERLWTLAVAWQGGRQQLLRPFQPYYQYAGAWQSWRMFVAPHRYPGRLHIDLRRGGTWETIYVARDPDRGWLGRQLDHDRMRSVIFRYAWPQYGRAWRHWCAWVAAQAATDFPDADAIRLRYWKARTPSPDEARSGAEPPGQWIRTRTLALPDGTPLHEPEPDGADPADNGDDGDDDGDDDAAEVP